MAVVGYHSNLDINAVNQSSQAGRHHMNPQSDDIYADAIGSIDDTPRTVALIGLGALAMLVALKALGFRFAFGVNVG